MVSVTEFPEERIRRWTDRELMDELERHTGDMDRDVEREAIRRMFDKISAIEPRKLKRS
jgi:hypothetical protein